MALGRTNIMTVGNSGGGVTTVDLPTRLNALSSNAGNALATLTLSYSDATYVTGVQVNYKTGSYPTSPTDGQSMTVTGAPTSITVTGLTNTLTYYFRVFLYREIDGVKYYQTDITNAKTSCIPRTVEIVGITPLVSAADHLVIVNSGNFTLTAPAGTKIILGSGGRGQLGGFVAEHTLSADVVNANCALTIAKDRVADGSKVKIGTTTYGCGSTEQVIQSKWGPIGGQGGGPIDISSGRTGKYVTGAGGGEGGVWWSRMADPSYYIGESGGNYGNYGNYGGRGYNWDGNKGAATDGICGKAGASTGKDCKYSDMTLGNGGGGGYAAGCGNGAQSDCYYYDENDEESHSIDTADAGEAGTGIMVIQWD